MVNEGIMVNIGAHCATTSAFDSITSKLVTEGRWRVQNSKNRREGQSASKFAPPSLIGFPLSQSGQCVVILRNRKHTTSHLYYHKLYSLWLHQGSTLQIWVLVEVSVPSWSSLLSNSTAKWHCNTYRLVICTDMNRLELSSPKTVHCKGSEGNSAYNPSQ